MILPSYVFAFDRRFSSVFAWVFAWGDLRSVSKRVAQQFGLRKPRGAVRMRPGDHELRSVGLWSGLREEARGVKTLPLGSSRVQEAAD